MSNDEKTELPGELIHDMCRALMEKYDTAQAIAILSSMITHIYSQSDNRSAFILAQPESNVAVVTTSLDALDVLPDVIEKTFHSLQETTQKEDFETTPKRPDKSKLH